MILSIPLRYNFISHTSYYIYAEEEVKDNGPQQGGGGTQETWTSTESC